MANIPTIEQLLEAGVHFGHRTNKWNPKMEKYIYAQRADIHIIDLQQTMHLFEEAVGFLKEIAKTKEIIIVGTKRQARDIVKNLSEKVGAHYIVNRWPGGLLTNFKIVSKSIKKLLDLEEELAGGVENRTKQEIVWLKRDQDRLERLFEGVKFMRVLPGAVIVVDPKTEKNGVREARKLGIPVVAIVDTNCDPDTVDFVIPANDDALKSLNLLLGVLTETILAAKGPSESITSLRKTHVAKLEKLAHDSRIRAELRRKEEEREKEELKALKEGRRIITKEQKGVRVIRTLAVKGGQKGAEKDTEKSSQKEGLKVKAVKKSSSLESGTKPASKPALGKELDLSRLSSRTANALSKAGIKSVDELSQMDDQKILGIPGIGKKALDEIRKLA